MFLWSLWVLDRIFVRQIVFLQIVFLSCFWNESFTLKFFTIYQVQRTESHSRRFTQKYSSVNISSSCIHLTLRYLGSDQISGKKLLTELNVFDFDYLNYKPKKSHFQFFLIISNVWKFGTLSLEQHFSYGTFSKLRDVYIYI